MKKLTLAALFFFSVNAFAVNITFDGIANGVSTFSYDADSDGTADAVFTKFDGGVWNFGGPTQSNYVTRPGLTAFSSDGDEIRVDFSNGAKTSVGFSFARNDACVGRSVGYTNAAESAQLRVYDSTNTLLGTATVIPECTLNVLGSFIEGQVTVTFTGTASYAVVDFQGSTAYILDNFNGTFGSSEIAPAAPAPIPTLGEWAMIFLASLMAMFGIRRMRRSK